MMKNNESKELNKFVPGAEKAVVTKIENIQSDMLRYRPNKLGFLLAILAIVFNAIMFFNLYETQAVTPDILLGVNIVSNILFMLAAFLLAEKCKAYDIKSGYITIGLGVVEIIRIFITPLRYLLKHNQTGTEVAVGIAAGQFTFVTIMMVLAAICLIGAGVLTIIRGRQLLIHLHDLEVKEGVK